MDCPTYPTRNRYFAHRYCRLLTKTCAAQEIGHAAFVLCVTIAHLEDAKRYCGAVTFFNEQLMPLVGVTKWDSLDRARKRAAESGWLHYEPGNRGKRKPGRYWVTIPTGLDSLDDAPCDESQSPANGEWPESQSPTHYPVNGEREGERDGEREGEREGEPSTLTLNPTPKDSSCPKLRFDEEDRAVAEWMLDLIRKLNPAHKKPNLDRWANTIRLMRERDGKTPEDIRAVFAWANADSFWQSNILSPEKLRDQFDQLTLKRKGNHARPSETHRRPGRVEAAPGKYSRYD